MTKSAALIRMAVMPESSQAENAIVAERRAKLARLRKSGDAYPNDFRRTDLSGTLIKSHGEKSREKLAEEKITARIAGRIMLKRIMGKVAFVDMQDMAGRIQIYAARDSLGDDAFSRIKEWDLGDIIGCAGELFLTQTGELTVRAKEARLLVKSLRPLPEKYHGLSDRENRYRRRYVSLIANADERRIFQTRARLIKFLRDFLDGEGYYEAETPMLLPIPGGAAARPFVTHHHSLGYDFYLRVAQELYLKRLIVGGLEKVFELNRNFRNEGLSPQHNPEFTMLEYNAAFQNCEDMMDLTEKMLRGLAVKLTGKAVVNYQGMELNFGEPFARLSLTDAVQLHHPQFSRGQLTDAEFLLNQLRDGGGEKTLRELSAENPDLGILLLLFFEKTTEHLLIQPTFIIDLPASVSPLARRSDANPNVAERFELFAAGRELANGFSELNDPELQADIFRRQAALKDKGDPNAMHFDADYIRALEFGLPPNGGGGIGVDRLVMLLADCPSIRDVILFPQMRPEEF